jgi:hypothetical protein
MDNFIDNLIKLKRNDINETKKLGALSYDKLKTICQRSNLLLNISKNFDDIKKECWLWEGTCMDYSKGHSHGIIYYKTNNIYVHRLMFHNFIADVPDYKRKSDSLQVNHSCSHENNGKCINPWHLYLGTPKQNIQDSLFNNTLKSFPETIFNDEIAEKLTNFKIQGKKNSELALEFNVTKKTIGQWISKLEINTDQKYNDDIKKQVIESRLSNISYKKITETYKVSKSTALRWMREYNNL